MTTNQKRAGAIAAGVLLLAGGAFFLASNKDGVAGIPIIGGVVAPDPECPLTSLDPRKDPLVERPAVAIKIENQPIAYPLSGLEDAEIVYEEPVEGGLTRFLAIYHCTDSAKAGPVRSTRVVDPEIVSPYTLIVGAAGGNDIVRAALDAAGIVLIDENSAGTAMQRVERPGIASEHTLYADTTAVRKLGRKSYDEAPPDDIFTFGDLEAKGKKTSSVTMYFGVTTSVTYEWDGERWLRSDNGAPLLSEAGEQIAVDNVLIEEHTINNSATLGDILGTPSPEIEDVTGSGRAVLFRDGQMIRGRWLRDSVEDPVRFETKNGDALVLSPGTTWIELLPDGKGDLKGGFERVK
jgi:hypothetical protein